MLEKPYRFAPLPVANTMMYFKIRNLATIDPANPLSDDAADSLSDDRAVQTLSMFGREDLIAAKSGDYRSSGCAPMAGGGDVFAAIERGARLTSIVIVSESHARSQHRGFITEIARRLRPLGYDALAMETLSNPASGTERKYWPTYKLNPGLPYLIDEDGYYLSEAGFGREGRAAKALGYRLVSYEANEDAPKLPDAASWKQRIAVREEAQASALAAYLKANPGTKLLVHVGYSHASELPRDDGQRWMANRLKAKTGIDPLTISQTVCRGGGGSVRLAALPEGEPRGMFDLVVDHPAPQFARGRPAWRLAAGDRAVTIPRALSPKVGWRVIEARPVGESEVSVPMDRVAIRPGEDVALMLPPGRYTLRVMDIPVAEVSAPPSR